MERMAQAAALCLIGSILGLLIKKSAPEITMTLSLSLGVLLLLWIATDAGEVLAFLKELTERTGVPEVVFAPLLKTVAIALVARTTADLCRDAGESALGSLTESAGAVCALAASLPLLRTVMDILWELL